VRIESGTNTIGGSTGSTGNLISGNGKSGIFLFGTSATANVISGNLVGTTASGSGALGNSFTGIAISNAPGNTIGGTIPSARNLLSANGVNGLNIRGSSAVQNQLIGNYVGTDASGSFALPNGNDGIAVTDLSASNFIGGIVTGAGNLISGNSFGAIYMSAARSIMIQGNLIGTKPDGMSALGNVFHNVEITNSYNVTIGGTTPGTGNRIAFAQSNPFSGVRIRSGNGSAGNSTNILISGNMIFSNNSLGIDLGAAGVNANVACNSGTANIANNSQNYPVLSLAASDANSVGVKGTLNSTANTAFRVQFFANTSCAGAGYGQGQTFLGEGIVTTDGSCGTTFTATINTPVTPGRVITATAIDPSGNTSEFSACVPVTAAPPLTVTWQTPPPADDPQLALSWPVTASGFVLKQTTSLTPPIQWTTVTNAVAVSNLMNVVTLSVTDTNSFFRLSFE
jgi:hypothetical protein